MAAASAAATFLIVFLIAKLYFLLEPARPFSRESDPLEREVTRARSFGCPR